MSTHSFSATDHPYEAFASEKLSPTFRILLAEDDPKMVDVLEGNVRSEGHEVVSTTHGEDVFRLLNLLNPDLVIIDVIMAEIDVLDAIAELRLSHPGVKIIAISGNPYLLTLASKHGANFVLAKPFGRYQLNHLVKTALQ